MLGVIVAIVIAFGVTGVGCAIAIYSPITEAEATAIIAFNAVLGTVLAAFVIVKDPEFF